jgi:hypothetical protein
MSRAMNNYTDSTKMGFAGGTLMGFVASINAEDILRTLLLTTMGAVVSFCVSLFLNFAIGWLRKNRHKP